MEKDEKKGQLKKRVMTITRRDFISGPYKKCPNPECLKDNSFGVFISTGGSKTYMRECITCGYRKDYDLPNIKKKILYLDQFVISNLIKLLDKDHPSHQKIKSNPFWETLFTKLEIASKSQAIICPDSFYHKDESLTGSIDFRLMKRLYEHFSSGKTLYPSAVVEKHNIIEHFKNWIEGTKVIFDFDPQNISFEQDLHSWSIGLMVSVASNPFPGQIEKLIESNKTTKDQLEEIWKRWQSDKSVSFTDYVKEETLGLGKGLMEVMKRFEERKQLTITRMASGEKRPLDIDDFIPPISNDILEEMYLIAKGKNIQEEEIHKIIFKYFNDIDSLLEIPQIKISSVMFAGLAELAKNGKKNPPKSTVDVQFISSYLPYCDALFVDKESALLLKKFPKNTPENFRLKEFKAKVYSLNNKKEFLDYLDKLIEEIPVDQINILEDVEGNSYKKPYWDIIENEKQELLNKK